MIRTRKHILSGVLMAWLLLPAGMALAKPAYQNAFQVLAHNVFMLPASGSDWGQSTRAGLIAEADYISGHDVVILNEIFDNPASEILLDGLKKEYKYQTPVLGRTRDGWDETLGSYSALTPEDGGVAIVSPWPIVEQVQYVYAEGCGWDYYANKGFVYARIDRRGDTYHVIGTHAQADDTGCDDPSASQVRASQFNEMRAFVEARDIPADEVLFIGGDMNVIKGTDEYYDMLTRVGVAEPDSYAGADTTWDPVRNGITDGQYPGYEQGQYLDYVFVSGGHAQPDYWHNQSRDVPSPRWRTGDYMYQDYSDHYPVVGFAYAGKNTPTESFKAVNDPYDEMHMRNEANGAYVRVDQWDDDGWVTTIASSPQSLSDFQLDNWYPADHAFCIRSGDYIRLESNYRPGYFWNWYLGWSGSYGYYTKHDDPTNQLRLHIAGDDGDCLKDGDQIYLEDRDTSSGEDYYVQRWPSGSWTDHVFLWSDSVGSNETWTVYLPREPQHEDWFPMLNFGN